jgi:hypothetical protein
VRTSNLVLKFLLEIAAVVSLAYWGAHLGTGAVPVIAAVAAPLLMVLVWAVYAAPRSERRLPMRWRIPLELGIFALAAVALAAAGQPLLAIVLAVIVVVNAALLTHFHQWEG